MEKTCESVWKKCLQIIKDNVSPQSFKTWFEPIKPIRLDGKVLTIEVPSQFFYEWLEEHYITLIKKVIRQQLGPEGRLEYSIVMEHAVAEKPYTVRIPTKTSGDLKNSPVSVPVNVSSTIRNPFIIPGLKKVNVESQLNPNYTFENFVEGDCNRLARSAGYAVAGKPGGTAFNPLLIYGGVGMGKTHLAHAIGIEIKNSHPGKTVLYVTSEKFTLQFIDAVRNNEQNDFVHFYQMMDVLIIDDIQFLAGKEKTQDVFFHIFNHLHQTGKQIILTSDKAPVDLQGMEQRLLSRFKWGLAADLQMPDLETRISILNRKMYQDGIELPKEIVEYIAYSITSNVRELEGALISILAQASLNKKSVTLELAKQMIDKFVKNTTHEVSIDYIQKIVCDYFDLPIEMLKSKTRKRQVVQARQIAMYFAKNMTKSSLSSIGAHCGGKDHATVLHACRTVNNLIETDKKFKASVMELQKKIAINAK
ncbi:MAG: chromosomal replication initiator protein DnaA [Bacteroidia bacterium]|jgi:chromosomal replication initiator protein|uniref:chromosomal replication initiator protein DnaA n=1 Tax=Candidatus Pollutiaquabacter sp. TaxID=3416354 RepID=UPI001A5C56D5|nr:chromosomal replication initiator protein DnaA [Bacteroidota bacterium]MBL7949269.1 chromosomal replication initiator protein DnaA [Bacteroidia bacterium]MBP6009374.1 chromosomal replication initiator protein DnaA [Bacteroidia bacterium]MBP7269707.1 chromosomal replication initiator protein DnaA [Bacteroidia bacterium]MBP7770949.1 chromosomal replication initiator protein DnaA [Bacteroidia bacterium]